MPARPYRLLILLALLLGVGIGLLVPRVRGTSPVLAPERAVRAVAPRGDLEPDETVGLRFPCLHGFGRAERGQS